MTKEEAVQDIKKSLKVLRGSGEIIMIKPLQPQTVDKIIKTLEQEQVLDKIRADIQRLRGCSCSCSDGIIDDIEDILDKYE